MGFYLNKKHIVFPVMLVLLSTFLLMGYVNQTDQTQQKETIKNLVIDAANLIEDKGEDAFSEFRQEGTQWFYDDIYVFVWMTDGIRVVYPPDPSGEGENMSLLLDVTGKAIGRLFVEIASSEEGEGWIDYSWPKPEETEPSSKQTYIKGVTVDEQTFLVGSGVYLDTIGNIMKPLQYVSITIECVIAATGLFIAVRKKRVFGYGIFLTFLIYVFYDLVNVLQIEVSDFTLYPVFFVATLSILWATLLIYMEK